MSELLNKSNLLEIFVDLLLAQTFTGWSTKIKEQCLLYVCMSPGTRGAQRKLLNHQYLITK